MVILADASCTAVVEMGPNVTPTASPFHCRGPMVITPDIVILFHVIEHYSIDVSAGIVDDISVITLVSLSIL